MANLSNMLEIEKQHLDSTIRSSTDKLGALLCEEFREFGASGKTYNKVEVLTSVTNSTELIDCKIDEYKIVPLGEGHILATYKLLVMQGDVKRLSLRSTVWKLVDSKWRMLFHQGTNQAQ